MQILLAHVPGLAHRHLQGGWLRSLTRPPPTHIARLVPSFPATPAASAQVLRSGERSAGHGVHHRDDPVRPSTPDLVRAYAHEGLRWFAFTALHEALVAAGPDSIGERESLDQLDGTLDELIAGARRENRRILVVGAPGVRAVCRVIEPLAPPAGGRVALEGSLAWISEPGPVQPGWRDRWLRTPGVAQLLCGRGLELLGCDPRRGTAARAEPGWSFEPGHGASGDPNVTGADAPVLLGWLGAGAEGWPKDVHDVRVAPTLRRAFGEARGDEDPLPFD